jgi:uncharacterized membrane protein YdjX (TVP38/TMEM64 family)
MSEPTIVAVAEEVAESEPTAFGKAWKIVAVVVILAVLGVFGRQAGGDFAGFASWVRTQGALGSMIFVAVYAVGTVAAVPGAVLTLFGGAIFGLAWGTTWVFLGATLGASASFLIARYLARKTIEKKLQGYERFAAVDRAIGARGLKIVFLLRLTPVFPFSFGNYALGLTRVRFLDYLFASFGMLPGTFLYVYYGKTVGDVVTLASGVPVAGGGGRQALTVVGLVATIAVTVLITRISRQALQQATKDAYDDRSTDPRAPQR